MKQKLILDETSGTINSKNTFLVVRFFKKSMFIIISVGDEISRSNKERLYLSVSNAYRRHEVLAAAVREKPLYLIKQFFRALNFYLQPSQLHRINKH